MRDASICSNWDNQISNFTLLRASVDNHKMIPLLSSQCSFPQLYEDFSLPCKHPAKCRQICLAGSVICSKSHFNVPADLWIWSSTFYWVEFVKHACVSKDQYFCCKRVSPLDQVKETCALAEPELRCIDLMNDLNLLTSWFRNLLLYWGYRD